MIPSRIRGIIVGVDFEESTRALLRMGAALADEWDAPLHLVHAMEDLPVLLPGFGSLELELDPTEAGRMAHASAVEALEDVWQDAVANDDLDVRFHSLPGKPAEAIAEAAADFAADLVIVGRGHRPPIARLGGTAERVVRSAPCSTLVASSERLLPLRSVVVPVDFGPAAASQVTWVLGMGRDEDTEVHLVCGYHIPRAVARALVRAGTLERVETDLRKQYARRLAELPDAEELGRFRLHAHATAGVPHRVIDELAEEVDADLIVIGAVGTDGPERERLGRTAERVLRDTERDVLIVRPFDGG